MKYYKVELRDHYDRDSYKTGEKNFTTKKNALKWLTEHGYIKKESFYGKNTDYYSKDYTAFALGTFEYFKLEDATIELK